MIVNIQHLFASTQPQASWTGYRILNLLRPARRSMATVSDSIPHLVRTARDPRQQGLHRVNVSKVDQVNSLVRLIQLELPSNSPAFTHLPGQWLDVYVPSIPQAGGFTITSAPRRAEEDQNGYKYLELAIQRSPNNPAAAFFWRPRHDILGAPLQVRVGGRFVYPPPDLGEEAVRDINKIVLVAGGVGINPLMSILEHLHLESLLRPARIRSLRLLYGTRARSGEAILFHDRIARILGRYVNHDAAGHDYRATMYLTGTTHWSPDEISTYQGSDVSHMEHNHRRISAIDLLEALRSPGGSDSTIVYVCGPPGMTDEFVQTLSRAEGMDLSRVLCEKWW